MEIREVTVEVGEVRNHPHEYGNYRCSVRITGELTGAENPNDMIAGLRAEARRHAVGECDAWEEQVEEERRIEKLTARLRGDILNIRAHGNSREEIDYYTDIAHELAAELPDDLQEAWVQRIRKAEEERLDALNSAEIETLEGVSAEPAF